MLNVDTIKNGLVIDHIKAGRGWQIFQWLGLDKAPFCAALIMNVASSKSGKKDIIKIENVMDIDYSVLGFIDPHICVNVIKDEKIVAKKDLKLPKQVVNVIKCKNPRCITSIEQELPHIFVLTDEEKEIYRCKYCEEKYSSSEF